MCFGSGMYIIMGGFIYDFFVGWVIDCIKVVYVDDIR